MNAPRSFVVLWLADSWRIAIAAEGESHTVPVELDSSVEPAQLAEALARALRSAGHAGEPVLLALGSERCISAVIPTEGLPSRGRQRAALYRLEERLPLAAEDVSADFLFHNGTALGACTPAGELGAIVKALAAFRIDVTAACPLAILAVNGARGEQRAAGLIDADVLLWQAERRIEIIGLKDATPVVWYDVPADFDDVALALANQVIAHKAPIRVATANMDESVRDQLAALPDVTVVGRADLRMHDTALRAAVRILRGDQPPLLDLLGGGTARLVVRQLRPGLRAAAIAAGLLCVCLILSCWIRGARYAAATARAEGRKAAAFRRLFPTQPLPLGIESRLRAVESQLRGPNSSGPPGGALPGGTPDALLALHDLLANLPTDTRYRLTELDIDGGRLSLLGEVAAHGDADAVATALRHAAQFTIDDPQTQQLDGNAVRFSILGSVRPTPSEQAPGRMP